MLAGITPKTLAIALSKLQGFSDPKVSVEQYCTDPTIAAEVIYRASTLGDVAERVITDLGAGTGLLGLGCALAGAKEVSLVEQDREALEIAAQNVLQVKEWMNSEKHHPVQIHTICANITEFTGKSETIIMNPPFGTKQKHADRPFFLKAFELAPVIYVFAKSSTREFVRKVSLDHGYLMSHKWRYTRFPLPRSYGFHKKPRAWTDVTVFRLESESCAQKRKANRKDKS
ncbi:methyltransferase [Candidatus Woesearchaeota archaeon]|nr:methyltransferase [Candidatus Woesearchaeota archaeon]